MRRWPGALLIALGCLAASPAFAQASPSAYTTGYRYDAAHRLTGTISPDPDGLGPLHFAAVRNTYVNGELTKVEKGELSSWKSESVAPANWGSAFSVFSTLTISYDAMGRKTKESLVGADGAKTLTRYSYDAMGRLECTAVRTDPAQWNSQPDACVAQTASANGPDQITRNSYDAAGQLTLVQKGYGTAAQANYAAYSYTDNGKRKDVTDGNGNKAEFAYDGHDRLFKWTFPSKTVAGALNAADYEQYGYDPNGNRTSLRKRDGSTITYAYDALNRVTKKIVPARSGLTADQTRDVYYGYDAEGRQLYARFDSGAATSDGVTNEYNGFGELTSTTLKMGAFSKTLTSTYDADGNRRQLTHPDGYAFTYDYDGLDRLGSIDQGATALDTFAYGSDGLVSSRSEGSAGASSVAYTWDGAGRLKTQSDRFAGGAGNVDWTLTYYPSSQVATDARSNSDYAFDTSQIGTVDRAYAVNGLNQYTSAGPASFTYDADGNLTSDGSWTYTWDVENRLVKAVQGGTTVNLAYDPLGRLYQTDEGTNASITAFLYDGDALALEYDSREMVINRYVHGSNAAADDPLVWYSGRTLGMQYFLHADRLGSIAGIADQNGAKSVIQTYDEYGINGTRAKNERFGYTGQAFIPELGLYDYKARFYSPTLGRFLQTDPIGYEGGINVYAYVGNDPTNKNDPSGLCTASTDANGSTRATQICHPVSTLNTSAKGRKFIEDSEGRENKVYLDSGNLPTVGIGHLVTLTEKLKIGDRISDTQVDLLFGRDLGKAESAVEHLIGELPVSQEEFDALADLAFNVGPNILSETGSPGLNRAISSGDYDEIGKQIRYTRDASGNSPIGLVVRNNRRQRIFLYGDYGP